jgi:hypothetical protein
MWTAASSTLEAASHAQTGDWFINQDQEAPAPTHTNVRRGGKKTCPKLRESWIDPKRSGNSGRYFIVLNCASEKGLSFDT